MCAEMAARVETCSGIVFAMRCVDERDVKASTDGRKMAWPFASELGPEISYGRLCARGKERVAVRYR